MKNLATYQNGNALINLYSDGTRIISFEGELNLSYPLNVDIRVSTKCAFGFNPHTQKSICEFCHESARTDGLECNYEELLEVLSPLPAGVELAIGSNELTPKLFSFLEACQGKGWVCNVTINQGHLHRDEKLLNLALERSLIKGLGISYRQGMRTIPASLLSYPNTVVHVIAGLDSFSSVVNLSLQGVNKILVLGEKDFGFNHSKVNLNSPSHKEWLWKVRMLFDAFPVVSFDNLALEQLKVSRFIPAHQWQELYQGEYSFYINAVEKTFSPSSRSPEKTPWGCGLQGYFSNLKFN